LSKFKPSTSYHSKLKVELNISSSKRLIGMIGRFDPQKNHLRFLECVHLLNKKFDDLAFIFVGNRIDHSNLELKKVIDKYNLSKSIYLLGKRNDIEFIMPALDILVLPSIYGEAFPNVIGEAMSCGVPCVVTDVGDSSSIVGSTGFVVSPNDNESLFRSISHMLNLSRDDYNQLSNDARKRIATHYDISVISKQYINLYNRYFL
jgi:glycosyltransferase involved in cell wall biosynthesis